MLLPASGPVTYHEPTCGPYDNRVAACFGPETANLHSHIAYNLVSSWTDPGNDVLQAYWAVYHDLFGPGETFEARLVMRSVKAQVCRHQALEA